MVTIENLCRNLISIHWVHCSKKHCHLILLQREWINLLVSSCDMASALRSWLNCLFLSTCEVKKVLGALTYGLYGSNCEVMRRVGRGFVGCAWNHVVEWRDLDHVILEVKMVRKEVCCDKKTTFVVRLHHLSNVSNLFILLISEDLYVFSMQDVMLSMPVFQRH